jgi:hypothetical protein
LVAVVAQVVQVMRHPQTVAVAGTPQEHCLSLLDTRSESLWVRAESAKQKQKLMRSQRQHCAAMQATAEEQLDVMQLLCSTSRMHLVEDDLQYNF